MDKNAIRGINNPTNYKRFVEIMRITLFFFFFCTLLPYAAESYSQSAKISLNLRATSLKEVIQEIERNSDYVFVFSDNVEQILDRRIDIDINTENIEDVLDVILAGTGSTYRILGSQIVLYELAEATATREVERTVSAAVVQQQTGRQITGRVVDEFGDAMIGVTIMEVGVPASGTITDIDGNFSLTVANDAAIRISFIGYLEQSINTAGQNRFDIILLEDVQALEELIVIGYGTQRRATITGAVSSISSDELMITRNPNTQNMLTGKLPGLRVIQQTSEPGVFNNHFDIRGLGSPLFVVDGVPRGDFPRMDANDIESISILKDASAAVFGVRSANGVVLITTRSGGQNQRATIEYSGSFGIQTVKERLQPLNALDRAMLANELTMRDVNAPSFTYSAEHLDDLRHGRLPDTDWYSLILRPTAPQSQHNISIRGGTEAVDYFINFGNTSQSSFFSTNSTSYERYNLRSNINIRIIDHLRASVRLNYITDTTRRQRYTATAIFARLWRSKPTDPVFANDQYPFFHHPTSGDIENVLPLIHPEISGEVTTRRNILQSNMSLNYDVPFIQGLSANFLFSHDRTFEDHTDFRRAFNEYRWSDVTQSFTSYTRNAQTHLTRRYATWSSQLWNISLNYENTFGRHRVGGLLLYEESYGWDHNFHASRFFSIPIPYLFAGDTENQVGMGSGFMERANRAVVGRITYDYDSRYLFQAAFRYDGSSRFPPGSQWGFFPSVEVGYRISEEPFFRDNVDFIDQLRFRATWGRLGDDGAAAFQFVEGFDFPASGNRGQGWGGGAMFGGTFVNALGFRNAPNPFITWFTATTKNVGVDVDAWRGLFGFTFDIFRRNRDGLLATPQVVIPGTFGAGVSQVNLDGDRTQGFELQLRHRNRVNRDFSYSATGHVSVTRTMRTHITQPNRLNSHDFWRNNQEYRWNDIWFGLGANGVFQNWDQIANSMFTSSGTLPGDPIYYDWNGDGVIDGSDWHPIATTINPGAAWQDQRNRPLMNFALMFNAQYRWFDLAMHFQGSAMSFISFGEQLLHPLMWDGNALPLLQDRWRPSDPNIDPYDPAAVWIPGRFPFGRTRANANSEFNIQSGNYVRLKNFEIGFTVPDNALLDWLNVSDIRLFMNAFNLLTITNVIGLDPERPTYHFGYMYPLNRTFNFGGTIRF